MYRSDIKLMAVIAAAMFWGSGAYALDTGPNKVYIDQIGDSNRITIQQVGGTNSVGGVTTSTDTTVSGANATVTDQQFTVAQQL